MVSVSPFAIVSNEQSVLLLLQVSHIVFSFYPSSENIIRNVHSMVVVFVEVYFAFCCCCCCCLLFFFLLLFCSFEKIKRREAEEKNHWSLLLCVRAGSLPLSRWETRNEFESCPMLGHRQCIPKEVWMPENLTLVVDVVVVVGTDNGICRI